MLQRQFWPTMSTGMAAVILRGCRARPYLSQQESMPTNWFDVLYFWQAPPPAASITGLYELKVGLVLFEPGW